MTSDEIARAILGGDFTHDDLHVIIAALQAKGRMIRSLSDLRALPTVRVGMKVGFGEKGAEGKRAWKVGRVSRISRTRVVVDVGGVAWSVPAGAVVILGEEEGA